MINDKIKKEKGISLISLVVAVVVLVILTNIIIYNAKDNLKIGKLKEMQNDIGNLRDKISSFYAINGKIPAKLVYNNEEAINKIKEAGVISEKVDTGDFLVIDLSALENLTLNSGQDYEKVKTLTTIGEIEKKWTDLYIINEASHNIFYVAGITIDNETFYTDYEAGEVDKASVNLRYVDNVKIPEGFYYAGGSKEEGLVISDVSGDDLENSKQGNQFVWVPVENMEDFHLTRGYGWGELESLSYLNTIKEPYMNGGQEEISDYKQMYDSVKLNKGFYIGRFETGKDSSGSVVVRKGVEGYNKIKWGNSITDFSGGAVEVSREFASSNSYTGVVSTLCYSVQWDATMQFMDNNYISGNCDTNSYVRNKQIEKGNYSGKPVKTGNNEKYAEKNIYDMAGNLWEMTMATRETTPPGKVVRGGCYSTVDNRPVSNTSHITIDVNNREDVGFRIALYLKNNEEENWSPAYDKQGIYQDKNGDTANIPQGFQVSRKNGENTIDEGLVVKDSKGNEFVWVPVNDINDFKRVEGYLNSTLQSLTNYTEPFLNGYSEEKSDYDAMKKSIESNHGFYIGRYEAGKENNKVVIKKDAIVYNGLPWGNSMTDINGNTGAVKIAKEFASNNQYNGVTSTLCYSIQWDTALKFIDSGYTGFAKDSSKQGWYKDNFNSKEGGNTTINPDHKTGIDLIYAENPNRIANRQKNIYDMAGNVFEWVIEAHGTDQRVRRGGTYSDDGVSSPASNRSSDTPVYDHVDRGFRITLYLQDKTATQ